MLIPTKVDTGKCEIEIARINTNFYQIYGISLVVETKSCHEYATRDDAILSTTSNYGYTRGQVIIIQPRFLRVVIIFYFFKARIILSS